MVQQLWSKIIKSINRLFMNNIQQTLSIIKPDGDERNLENEIKEIFKKNVFQYS